MSGLEFIVIGSIIASTIVIHIGLKKLIKNCSISHQMEIDDEQEIREEIREEIRVGKIIKSSKNNGDCIICFEKMNKFDYLRLLDCGHKFHKQCIDSWLYIGANCPICRTGV